MTRENSADSAYSIKDAETCLEAEDFYKEFSVADYLAWNTGEFNESTNFHAICQELSFFDDWKVRYSVIMRKAKYLIHDFKDFTKNFLNQIFNRNYVLKAKKKGF